MGVTVLLKEGCRFRDEGGAIARIAIVGVEGFNRSDTDTHMHIRCCSWHDVAKIGNLADFDAVLLNLPDPTDRQHINWSEVHTQLNLYTMRDVTRPGGSFIVIGDPRFDIERHDPETETPIVEPFLTWTGLQFFWDPRPGETKEFDADYNPEYRRLLERLNTWSYSLRGCELDEIQWGDLFHLDRLHARDQRLVVKKKTVASNRYGADLVFETRVQSEDLSGLSSRSDLHFGPIVFVPRPDLSADEAVALILEDIFEIPIALPEPAWIRDRAAPGQGPLDSEIERLNSILKTSIHDVREAMQKQAAVRRPLKLLYEGGTSLEEVVRETLKELGAVVEPPTEVGREDGWIEVNLEEEDFKGVLEIKSTRNETFNEAGIRQLTEWVRRGIEERQVRFKGIFIGNSAIRSLPEERSTPFSDSWARSAQLHGYVALTTTDLYAAFCKHRAGELETEVFWRTLFKTDGIMSSVLSGNDPTS